MNRVKITGQRFGRLIVLKEIQKLALCKCDCGKTVELRRHNLIYDNTKSCGCLKSETGKKAAKYMQQLHTLPFGEAAFRETYRNYSYGAKKRGHAFLLTEMEARRLFEGECFYCGCQPSNLQRGKNGHFAYNGIDRKNNLEGYIAENCVPCCPQCNWAKRDLPMVDFITWLNRCFNHLKPVVDNPPAPAQVTDTEPKKTP